MEDKKLDVVACVVKHDGRELEVKSSGKATIKTRITTKEDPEAEKKGADISERNKIVKDNAESGVEKDGMIV